MAHKSIFRLFAAGGALLAAGQAMAGECETETLMRVQGHLTNATLEAGILAATSALLSQPRFFEDTKSGSTCTRPRLDQPGYPAIPVRECTYQRFGLSGWVLVANPGADVVAKWVSAACSQTSDPKTCAARLAAHAWCTSQFSFPIAGNLIAPRKAGLPAGGSNSAFVDGVPVALPAGLRTGTPVSSATQKQRFSAIAADGKRADILADRGNWPAGVSPAGYARFGKASKVAGRYNACAVDALREQWSEISRTAYNEAWRNGRYSMFDAAAKALMADTKPDAAACASG